MFHVRDVKKENIWNYAQNKPSLVAADLESYGVPFADSMKILLARGVFKWLGVRRSLIKLKDQWRNNITLQYQALSVFRQNQDWNSYWYTRGYLEALESARKEVRGLCHSERWQAPDFDEKAQKFLREMEN